MRSRIDADVNMLSRSAVSTSEHLHQFCAVNIRYPDRNDYTFRGDAIDFLGSIESSLYYDHQIWLSNGVWSP